MTKFVLVIHNGMMTEKWDMTGQKNIQLCFTCVIKIENKIICHVCHNFDDIVSKKINACYSLKLTVAYQLDMISLWVCAALLVVAQVEESSAAPTGKISLLHCAFKFRSSFGSLYWTVDNFYCIIVKKIKLIISWIFASLRSATREFVESKYLDSKRGVLRLRLPSDRTGQQCRGKLTKWALIFFINLSHFQICFILLLYPVLWMTALLLWLKKILA